MTKIHWSKPLLKNPKNNQSKKNPNQNKQKLTNKQQKTTLKKFHFCACTLILCHTVDYFFFQTF